MDGEMEISHRHGKSGERGIQLGLTPKHVLVLTEFVISSRLATSSLAA